MNHTLKPVLLTRKSFLKITAILLSVYPLKLFYDVSRTRPGTGTQKQQVLTMDLPEGISFHTDIIAWREKDKTVFFAARCPHLGCQINRFENERLICPCHGSQFSMAGKVLEGPAVRDLTELSFAADAARRQYTVFLPN
ncbi:Rieske (2Fe-2S) protein [bacterium]|nr:Rieske (2Fe-2S) protein [bacterium]